MSGDRDIFDQVEQRLRIVERPLGWFVAVLLVAGLWLLFAMISLAEAGAAPPSPPHLFRIVEGPAYILLPSGDRIVVPTGSEFPVRSFRYVIDARTTEINATAEIFRDGFGSNQ